MSQSVLNFLTRTEVWASAAALIGFLTLTWVIRGAPIGQSMREESAEAPASGYRDRVIVSAVIGFLLVLFGGILATTSGIPWSLPAFAAGFGVLVAVMKHNRRFRHASPTIRRVYEFANTALTASLISGILVVGNVVAFKYGGRAIDLTHDQAFSLSSRTIAQLRSLDRPISFTVFFGNSERSVRQLDRVRQLLDLYKAANPSRVSVEYLDPNLDMKEFEGLVKRVPQIETSPGGGIVLAFGEGEGAPLSLIGTYELFAMKGNPAESRPDRFVTSFSGEDAVTSALVRLREGERSKIAFTTGHGEPSAGELDPSLPGLGLWRARLASVGIDVVETNLLREDVPDSVKLVVICGPKRPFQHDELERLKAFIIRNGQLIVLVGNTDPSGLDDFLKAYNVEIGTGLVVDPRYNYQRRPFAIYAPIPEGSNQPIVQPLIGRYVLLPNAAPMTTLGGPPKRGVAPSQKPSNPGVVALPFVRTGPDSWVETTPNARPVVRDPANDIAGPINVGVAVVIPPQVASDSPKPRMVVFSSSTAADNQVVRLEPTNLDLMMNAVQWLRGRPSALGIHAKTHESLLFAADPGLRTRLVMVPTLLAVLVILGLGVTTYVARRD
jgi:ABC-type uncharacterized transport system